MRYLFVLIWPAHSACLLPLRTDSFRAGQSLIIVRCPFLLCPVQQYFLLAKPRSISDRSVTSPGPLSRTHFRILQEVRDSRTRALRVTASVRERSPLPWLRAYGRQIVTRFIWAPQNQCYLLLLQKWLASRAIFFSFGLAMGECMPCMHSLPSL